MPEKFKPNEADKITVRVMAAAGFPHEAIARCLGEDGIDPKTLRKHFEHELATASARANAAVANKLYQMAIAGDPPAATMFWLKCRANWREVQAIDHSGPGGTPIDTVSARESLRAKIEAIGIRLRGA